MSELILSETQDVIVTIRLAIAFNPLRDPEEVTRACLLQMLNRLETEKLRAIVTNWIISNHTYQHFKVFYDGVTTYDQGSYKDAFKSRLNKIQGRKNPWRGPGVS